jgi:hypothetical protein
VRDIPAEAPDAVERLLGELNEGASHQVEVLRDALDGSRLAGDLAKLLGMA